MDETEQNLSFSNNPVIKHKYLVVNIILIALIFFIIGIMFGFFAYIRNKKTSTINPSAQINNGYISLLGTIPQPQLTKYRIVFKKGYPNNHIGTLLLDRTQKNTDALKQPIRERLVDMETAICALTMTDMLVYDKVKDTLSPVKLPQELQWKNSLTPMYRLQKINNRYLFTQYFDYSQKNYLFDVQDKKFIPVESNKASTDTFGNMSGIRYIGQLQENSLLFSIGGGDACCAGGAAFSFNPQSSHYKTVLAYTYGCCGSGKDSLWGYVQSALLVSRHTYDDSKYIDTFHDVRLIDPLTGKETILLSEKAMPKQIGLIYFDKVKQLLYLQERLPNDTDGKIYEFNPVTGTLADSTLKIFPTYAPEAPAVIEDTLDIFVEKEKEFIHKEEEVLQPTFPLFYVEIPKDKPTMIQVASDNAFEGSSMVNTINTDDMRTMIQKKKPELLAIEKKQTYKFIFSYASILSDTQIVFVYTKQVYQKQYLLESYHYLGVLDMKSREVFLLNENPVKYSSAMGKLRTMYINAKDVVVGIDKKSKTILIQDFTNFFTYRIIDLENMKRGSAFYFRDFNLSTDSSQYGVNIYKPVLDKLKLPYKILDQNRAFSDYEMQVKPSTLACDAGVCTFTVGVQKLNEKDIQTANILIDKDNTIHFLP